MNSKFKVSSAKFKVALVLACVFTALTALAEPERWRVFMEPKFMKPELAFPIPNAERTVWVPGELRLGEVHLFSRAEFEALGVPWEMFKTRAAEKSAATLKVVVPEFTRNKKKVIQYARLVSNQPLITPLLIAPGFLAKFQDVFGSKLLVVVPNRHVAYVFPALASDYRDYAPMVMEAYRATPYPVSLEVFEISSAGIRAIGAYEPP